MKQLNFYYKHQLNTPNEVFDYLVNTILLNNRTWEYFINWDKVFKNVSQYKIELNILNSLCGSKDFDNELIYHSWDSHLNLLFHILINHRTNVMCLPK